MAQKRAEVHNDRLLVRYLEPLAAWLGELGGDPDPGILELAWRTALECHPHDSICGCSVDAGHEEIDTRLARRPPPMHLRDAAGRKVPARAELEEPGAVIAAFALPASVAAGLVRGLP